MSATATSTAPSQGRLSTSAVNAALEHSKTLAAKAKALTFLEIKKEGPETEWDEDDEFAIRLYAEPSMIFLDDNPDRAVTITYLNQCQQYFVRLERRFDDTTLHSDQIKVNVRMEFLDDQIRKQQAYLVNEWLKRSRKYLFQICTRYSTGISECKLAPPSHSYSFVWNTANGNTTTHFVITPAFTSTDLVPHDKYKAPVRLIIEMFCLKEPSRCTGMKLSAHSCVIKAFKEGGAERRRILDYLMESRKKGDFAPPPPVPDPVKCFTRFTNHTEVLSWRNQPTIDMKELIAKVNELRIANTNAVAAANAAKANTEQHQCNKKQATGAAVAAVKNPNTAGNVSGKNPTATGTAAAKNPTSTVATTATKNPSTVTGNVAAKNQTGTGNVAAKNPTATGTTTTATAKNTTTPATTTKTAAPTGAAAPKPGSNGSTSAVKAKQPATPSTISAAATMAEIPNSVKAQNSITIKDNIVTLTKLNPNPGQVAARQLGLQTPKPEPMGAKLEHPPGTVPVVIATPRAAPQPQAQSAKQQVLKAAASQLLKAVPPKVVQLDMAKIANRVTRAIHGIANDLNLSIAPASVIYSNNMKIYLTMDYTEHFLLYLKEWNMKTLTEQLTKTLTEVGQWPPGKTLRNIYVYELPQAILVRLQDTVIDQRLVKGSVYHFKFKTEPVVGGSTSTTNQGNLVDLVLQDKNFCVKEKKPVANVSASPNPNANLNPIANSNTPKAANQVIRTAQGLTIGQASPLPIPLQQPVTSTATTTAISGGATVPATTTTQNPATIGSITMPAAQAKTSFTFSVNPPPNAVKVPLKHFGAFPKVTSSTAISTSTTTTTVPNFVSSNTVPTFVSSSSGGIFGPVPPPSIVTTAGGTSVTNTFAISKKAFTTNGQLDFNLLKQECIEQLYKAYQEQSMLPGGGGLSNCVSATATITGATLRDPKTNETFNVNIKLQPDPAMKATAATKNATSTVGGATKSATSAPATSNAATKNATASATKPATSTVAATKAATSTSAPATSNAATKNATAATKTSTVAANGVKEAAQMNNVAGNGGPTSNKAKNPPAIINVALNSNSSSKSKPASAPLPPATTTNAATNNVASNSKASNKQPSNGPATNNVAAATSAPTATSTSNNGKSNGKSNGATSNGPSNKSKGKNGAKKKK